MISVLLPYRDAESTIGEALESVLAERTLPLELIAIDDGSTDESRHVVDATARRDPRVVSLAAGGVGIARALMRALESARGESIARMDADDVSLPGRFEKQMALLEREPSLGVVGTRVEGFPTVGPGLAAYLTWQNGLIDAAQHASAIFVESPLCHPSVLIRRSALEAVGGYRDGPFPEDYDLWLRLHAAGFGLAKVDEVLLRWRHVEGRATFSDPRCSLASFVTLRAEHLARRLRGITFAIWGAGKTGRRLARALEAHGLAPEFFVDIDPAKIGRCARGRKIVSPDDVQRGSPLVVVAVGARGARDIVRARLSARGFVEGSDHFCAA